MASLITRRRTVYINIEYLLLQKTLSARRGCSIDTHCFQPCYSVEDSLITTKEYGSESLHKLNGAEAIWKADDGGEGYRSFLGLVSLGHHRGTAAFDLGIMDFVAV